LRIGYGIPYDSDEEDAEKNDESKNHGSINKKKITRTNRGKNKGLGSGNLNDGKLKQTRLLIGSNILVGTKRNNPNPNSSIEEIEDQDEQ